jgi:hypothetical protein
MKRLLLISSVITLVATTGCIIPEGEGHGREVHERHEEVIVGPPVIVARPPEIIVR